MLLLIAELHESGRFSEPALRLVRDAARTVREEARAEIPGKSAAESFRRIVRKLDRAARKLDDAEDSQTRRAWRWALDARVSRRALALRQAIDKAGSVYLADRLHAARIALKKLRYALELDVESRGVKSTPELRALKRMQEVLGRLHDLQVLVDSVRHVQASLKPPSVSAWRDLDVLLTSLEQNCRRLHARYVGERDSLIDICERLSRRGVPAKAVHAAAAPDRSMAAGYELYLIRHGIAEERGEAWPDDTKRPLTDRGIARLKKEARALARIGVAFDVVLTSPLVRARQTADAVASTFEPRPPIVAIESLSPGGTYQALLADLEKQARRSRIALVGHEPGIGELAARMIGSRPSARVQEGRGLPHRLRNDSPRGPRRAALVHHAEDPPRAAEVIPARLLSRSQIVRLPFADARLDVLSASSACRPALRARAWGVRASLAKRSATSCLCDSVLMWFC
jgi:phosphohistidine phosphatase